MPRRRERGDVRRLRCSCRLRSSIRIDGRLLLVEGSSLRFDERQVECVAHAEQHEAKSAPAEARARTLARAESRRSIPGAGERNDTRMRGSPSPCSEKTESVVALRLHEARRTAFACRATSAPTEQKMAISTSAVLRSPWTRDRGGPARETRACEDAELTASSARVVGPASAQEARESKYIALLVVCTNPRDRVAVLL